MHDGPENNFSIIILTLNEEKHIERALLSATRLTPYVYVVDSQSSDRTVEIANRLKATVVSGKFGSFSEKLNWAIDNLPIHTRWTIRLDADEVFSEYFLSQIGKLVLAQNELTSGIWVRRQIWFMGKWLRHGAIYPVFALRVWRTGYARCKPQVIDEYMEVAGGRSIQAPLDIIDNPRTSIREWVEKHNRYSDIEAEFRIAKGVSFSKRDKTNLARSTQEARSAFLKNEVYYRSPIFVRPFGHWAYKYLLRLGFRDGLEGFVWHLLHSFWYRFLVDVKIYERQKKSKAHDAS